MVNKNSWSEDADFRLKNKKWLRYSSNIARRILAVIEDRDNFSQANLARLLDVSQQQISKIVKGHENLTLKTIAEIATALDTELITFPDYKYSKNKNNNKGQLGQTPYLQVAYKSDNYNDTGQREGKSEEAIQTSTQTAKFVIDKGNSVKKMA